MAEGNSRLRWPVRRRAAMPEETVEDIAAGEIAAQEAAEQLPPPPPNVVEDPPQRFNLAVFRLAALGLVLVLALALALVKLFVAGPPSIAQLRAQSGVDTWSQLTVGVHDDQPGIALYDSKSGIWSGFDIDIAYMIAEDLGFRRQEVKFYAIETEDRARMQATDPANHDRRVPVDLVIASYSITAARIAEGVTFSDAYFYTEQSALTLTGHAPVSTFSDLKGQRVCTMSASTSAGALGDAGAVVISKNRVSDCFGMLDRGEIDAISTDAAILGGFKARDKANKYHHWDMGLDSSEKWGVNVGANPALQTLVDVTLYKSWKDPHDERWELAWQNNIQTELDPNLPTPLAVASQPPVPRPDVRQLPWENELP